LPKIYHVKKAKSDNPVVKKGESYYWWKHYGRPIEFSKHKPSRSRTALSPFFSEVYDIEDNELCTIEHPEELKEAINRIKNLKEKTQDIFNNMPKIVLDLGVGDLLESRINSIEKWKNEIESIKEYFTELLEERKDETIIQEFMDTIALKSFKEE